MSSRDNEMMSAKQVKDALGSCLATVYVLADQGELPCFRIGRSRRFWRADVDAFLMRNRQESRHVAANAA